VLHEAQSRVLHPNVDNHLLPPLRLALLALKRNYNPFWAERIFTVC
jgi:hypothetical protein